MPSRALASRATVVRLTVAAVAIGCCLTVGPAHAEVGSEAAAPKLELISQTADGDGESGDDLSEAPSVSPDGRFVVFESEASDLVPGDDNGVMDVFLRDRQTGVTELISRAEDGSPGNHWSRLPDVSDDGRFVVFISNATNLVPGITGFPSNAYVLDREAGTMDAATRSVDGSLDPGTHTYDVSISGNGAFVAFTSSGTTLVTEPVYDGNNVYVRDLDEGVTSVASAAWEGGPADWHSGGPSLSADGRFLAFDSGATNLVEATDPSHVMDVYVRDLQTGITEVVSRAAGGGQPSEGSLNPDIAADGQSLAFTSYAGDLVTGGTRGIDVFLHDLGSGTTTLISRTPAGTDVGGRAEDAAISVGGRYITFASSTALLPGTVRHQRYVYRYDVVGDRLRFVVKPDELAHKGLASDAQVALDGSVVFTSRAKLLAGDKNGADRDVYFRRLG